MTSLLIYDFKVACLIVSLIWIGIGWYSGQRYFILLDLEKNEEFTSSLSNDVILAIRTRKNQYRSWFWCSLSVITGAALTIVML